MKMRLTVSALLIILASAVLSVPANAQSVAGSGSTSGGQQAIPPPPQPQEPPQTNQPKIMSPRAANVQPGQPYRPPTEKEKLRSFAFDAFGPYAFVSSSFVGGIQQARGVPPEWGQGWDAYGVRVASNFGVNLVGQTARYGLAEIFHEDTLYYRCECSGFGHRLGHALISTVTARRGTDGHRTFSFSSLAAPYAGAEAAALLWYPSRYDASDGFRMGNYNLLVQAGVNVALEFVYGGPNTLLSKYHVPVVSSVTGSSMKQ
jgi:hypothetical protein